jgi:dTDP-4-amino-4,6-dideoxygalactose transaminase
MRELSGDGIAAMVAVNLLGVGDGADELLNVASRAGIPVIQDSAQALSPLAVTRWRAKYVVLSFGRGKPLNLHGGGALLTNSPIPEARHAPRTLSDRLHDRVQRSGLAGALFNAATHPRSYWLTSRLPGLRVGATTYRPLERLIAATPERYETVRRALRGYLTHQAPRRADWSEAARDWARFGIHSLAPEGTSPSDLLRFPLVTQEPKQQRAIMDALDKLGVGCSTMYGLALNRLSGVPAEIAAQGPFPAADSFAACLITLPTHSFVTANVIERVDACIRSVR